MPAKDPVSDALLNVYNLYADRRQAELDLERARTAEQVGARSAVPGVIAQLQQNKLKEAKQRAAIQKAQQEGQMTPQQAAPPLTEVTGQTRARDSLAGAGAEAIASFVSGGRGIKGALGTGMAAGSPVLQAAGGAMIPQQQPGASPIQTTPGEPIPIERNLSGLEQGLALPGMLMSLAGRSPQGIVEFGKRLFTGKETVGYTTAEEQAARVQQQIDLVATPLSVLRSRMDSQDDATSQSARDQFQAGLDKIRQNFGNDFANTVESRSQDLYLVRDEQRRQAEEDPAYQKRKLDFNLANEVATNGLESLTPQKRQYWDATHRTPSTTVINQMPSPLTKPNVTKFQAEVSDQDVLINQLNKIDSLLFNPDGTPNKDALHDAFTLKGQAGIGVLHMRDRSGVESAALDEGERKRLDRAASIETNLAILNVPYMHKLIGATMSPAELERMDALLANFQKSPTKNLADLRELRESMGLAKLRYLTMLNSPSFQGMDPGGAIPFSNVKELARQQAQAAYDHFRAQGMDEAAAGQAVRDAFRNSYGLNIDSLGGVR